MFANTDILSIMYNHPPDGGLKTRIMASIQTPNRQISVKETYEEVCKALDFQWMELTEVISFYGEMTGKTYKDERIIRLNRDYIIEVQP
jgi:hypothetical protein